MKILKAPLKNGPILNNEDQNKENVSSGDQSIYKDGQEIEYDKGEEADEHQTGKAADVVDREPIDTIPDKKEHDIIEYPIGAPQCYLCDKSVCDCDFGFKWHPREQFDADSHSNLLEERIIYLERIIEDHYAETRRFSDDVKAHGFLLKQMQHKFGWRCDYAVSVRDELVPESKRKRRGDWIGNMMRKIAILFRGRYSGVDVTLTNIDIGGAEMKKLFVIRFPFNVPVCSIQRSFGTLCPFVRVDEINPHLDDQGLQSISL
ncbi:unnamed protein product [Allacma fusca]|uniref:Uncharacterized protein n=1 Tax=Allacma fusca TaxID=39272 RepID=A0A8J2PAE0_9HEXA|nr:unnamed protein product [Allacma fusca]